jgi:hypothetical protein
MSLFGNELTRLQQVSGPAIGIFPNLPGCFAPLSGSEVFPTSFALNRVNGSIASSSVLDQALRDYTGALFPLSLLFLQTLTLYSHS